MADQDYPTLYADMEESAQRTRAAAIAFEHVLGGPEADLVPVNGYPDQPTIAGRVKTRMDQLQAPVEAAIEAAKRFLGARSTPPTTRADGSPIRAGDEYFNTAQSAQYIWNGTAWYVPVADGQAIQQAFAASSGATKVGYGATTVDAALAALEKAVLSLGLVISPITFGAINDKNRHPLSERFSTLAAAKAVYPHATALTDTIDWAATQAALNTGLPVRISGVPVINRELVGKPGQFNLSMDPGAYIDATASDFVGTNAVSCTGSLTRIANLSADLVEGGYTMNFSAAHGLAVGDWVCIWNTDNHSFSSFRDYYYAGEWVRVQEVLSTTSVSLAGYLYAGYIAAQVQIFKINKNKVSVTGVEVRTGSAVSNAIFIEAASELVMRDTYTRSVKDAGIVLSKCPFGVVTDCSAFNVGATGDDYGLIAANCQNIKVTGGKFHARRHAVSLGSYDGPGCVPCRNVTVNGADLTNDPRSQVWAADMHGNSEDCWYFNCNIRGGATFQGKNNGIRGGTLTANQLGVLVYSAELLGGRFTLDGVAMYTTANPQLGGRGLIDIGGNNDALSSKTDGGVTFVINGGSLNGKNLGSLTSLVLFRNAGTIYPVSVDIKNVDFQVNALGFILRSGLEAGKGGVVASNGFSILNLTGNLPNAVALHGASTGSYVNLPHRLPTQTVSQTIQTVTTASSVSGTPVVYKYKYPRPPAVIPGISNITYVGTVAVFAGADPADETGFTPVIRTPANSNFSAAVPVKYNASIGITEF